MMREAGTTTLKKNVIGAIPPTYRKNQGNPPDRIEKPAV